MLWIKFYYTNYINWEKYTRIIGNIIYPKWLAELNSIKHIHGHGFICQGRGHVWFGLNKATDFTTQLLFFKNPKSNIFRGTRRKQTNGLKVTGDMLRFLWRWSHLGECSSSPLYKCWADQEGTMKQLKKPERRRENCHPSLKRSAERTTGETFLQRYLNVEYLVKFYWMDF